MFFMVSIIWDSFFLEVIFERDFRGLFVLVEIKNLIELIFWLVSWIGWLFIIGVFLLWDVVLILNFVLKVDFFM